MKLLLDSANYNEITRICDTSAISGVTTNPSLMAKEVKGDYLNKITNIAQLLHSTCLRKHLSAEVITLDPNEMLVQAVEIREALKFSAEFVDLHIKIPVTLENLSVITSLEGMGIKVNATACMMHSQAKMAIDAGASIISYFYNRIKDGGGIDPDEEINKTASYRRSPEFCGDPSKAYITAYGAPSIICGSIRKPEDVTACWESGSEYVTASLKIIELLLKHEQTDIAINGFQKDIEAWLE